ncbi:LytTR family transcriptional regulator [Runella sp. SP2]|nr:LytTR family transcriptional regulator [Runella sp. SP2]
MMATFLNFGMLILTLKNATSIMSQASYFSLPPLKESRLSHIFVHVGGIPRPIDKFQIVYMQSEVNYTRLFLKSGKSYLESKTLKHFNEVLGNVDFVRIHKSYLVNAKHIVAMTPDNVLLLNGEELPISRRKRRALKKDNALTKFWGN